MEPIKQSCQFLHDPIVDVLDDLCCPSHVSFSSYRLKSDYDIDMIEQSLSWSGSTGVSFQTSSENLHSNQNLHNNIDSICTLPSLGFEVVEFEYQEIGHVYHAPISIYMGDLFFSECQLIPGASLIFHSSKALCYEDQVGNQFLIPLQA